MKQIIWLFFFLLVACSLPERSLENQITAAVVHDIPTTSVQQPQNQYTPDTSALTTSSDPETLAEQPEVILQTLSPGGFGVAVTIDVPLPQEDDSPGPSSSGTSLLKSGSFRWKATGEVFIYHMTDGRRMLALQGFSMEPAANIHLLLVNEDPTKGIDLGQLVSKKGAYQYIIPSAVDLSDVNEVMLYIPHKKLVWATAILMPDISNS